MSDTDIAYVARCLDGCGAIVFAAVDVPMTKRATSREIAKLIREGYSVERTTVALARPDIGLCKNRAKSKAGAKTHLATDVTHSDNDACPSATAGAGR